MNLILERKQYRSDGVFSQLKDEFDSAICETLEHSYPLFNTSFFAKIPAGVWACKRSDHLLHGMDHPFSTFEVEIPGHNGILFHWGNYQKDSSGCILVGTLLVNENGMQMLTNSRVTFQKFMELQAGVDSFNLTVIG